MRNFFAGLFLLLGVGCLGVAGFSAYQDRVISPQVSSASSPVLFSQVSDISSYVSLPVLEGMARRYQSVTESPVISFTLDIQKFRKRAKRKIFFPMMPT